MQTPAHPRLCAHHRLLLEREGFCSPSSSLALQAANLQKHLSLGSCCFGAAVRGCPTASLHAALRPPPGWIRWRSQISNPSPGELLAQNHPSGSLEQAPVPEQRQTHGRSAQLHTGSSPPAQLWAVSTAPRLQESPLQPWQSLPGAGLPLPLHSTGVRLTKQLGRQEHCLTGKSQPELRLAGTTPA